MRLSGYTPQRAAHHDQTVKRMVDFLNVRGWPARELSVDGHRPDILLTATGNFIDVKAGKGKNIAIAVDSLLEYQHIQRVDKKRVYIVWAPPYKIKATDLKQPRRVYLPDTLTFVSGPRRCSGNGSNTDYVLADPSVGWTDSESFFPDLSGTA